MSVREEFDLNPPLWVNFKKPITTNRKLKKDYGGIALGTKKPKNKLVSNKMKKNEKNEENNSQEDKEVIKEERKEGRKGNINNPEELKNKKTTKKKRKSQLSVNSNTISSTPKAPIIIDSGHRFKAKRKPPPKPNQGYKYRPWLPTDTEDESLTHGEESSGNDVIFENEKNMMSRASEQGFVLEHLIGTINNRPFNSHLLGKNVDAIPSDDSFELSEESSQNSFNRMESLISEFDYFLFDSDLLQEVKDRPRNDNGKRAEDEKQKRMHKNEVRKNQKLDIPVLATSPLNPNLKLNVNFKEDLFFEKDEWFPRDRERMLLSDMGFDPEEEDTMFSEYGQLDSFLKSPDVIYTTVNKSRNRIGQADKTDHFMDKSINIHAYSFHLSSVAGNRFSTLDQSMGVSLTLREEDTVHTTTNLLEALEADPRTKIEERIHAKLQLRDYKVNIHDKRIKPKTFVAPARDPLFERKVKHTMDFTSFDGTVMSEESSYEKSRRLEDSLDASKAALYQQELFNLDLLEKYGIDAEKGEDEGSAVYFQKNPLAPQNIYAMTIDVKQKNGSKIKPSGLREYPNLDKTESVVTHHHVDLSSKPLQDYPAALLKPPGTKPIYPIQSKGGHKLKVEDSIMIDENARNDTTEYIGPPNTKANLSSMLQNSFASRFSQNTEKVQSKSEKAPPFIVKPVLEEENTFHSESVKSINVQVLHNKQKSKASPIKQPVTNKKNSNYDDIPIDKVLQEEIIENGRQINSVNGRSHAKTNKTETKDVHNDTIQLLEEPSNVSQGNNITNFSEKVIQISQNSLLSVKISKKLSTLINQDEFQKLSKKVIQNSQKSLLSIEILKQRSPSINNDESQDISESPPAPQTLKIPRPLQKPLTSLKNTKSIVIDDNYNADGDNDDEGGTPTLTQTDISECMATRASVISDRPEQYRPSQTVNTTRIDDSRYQSVSISNIDEESSMAVTEMGDSFHVGAHRSMLRKYKIVGEKKQTDVNTLLQRRREQSDARMRKLSQDIKSSVNQRRPMSREKEESYKYTHENKAPNHKSRTKERLLAGGKLSPSPNPALPGSKYSPAKGFSRPVSSDGNRSITIISSNRAVALTHQESKSKADKSITDTLDDISCSVSRSNGPLNIRQVRHPSITDPKQIMVDDANDDLLDGPANESFDYNAAKKLPSKPSLVPSSLNQVPPESQFPVFPIPAIKNYIVSRPKDTEKQPNQRGQNLWELDDEFKNRAKAIKTENKNARQPRRDSFHTTDSDYYGLPALGENHQSFMMNSIDVGTVIPDRRALDNQSYTQTNLLADLIVSSAKLQTNSKPRVGESVPVRASHRDGKAPVKDRQLYNDINRLKMPDDGEFIPTSVAQTKKDQRHVGHSPQINRGDDKDKISVPVALPTIYAKANQANDRDDSDDGGNKGQDGIMTDMKAIILQRAGLK